VLELIWYRSPIPKIFMKFIDSTVQIVCMALLNVLIHEILTVCPHFREANNFLWPFKLKAPLGGMKKKRKKLRRMKIEEESHATF